MFSPLLFWAVIDESFLLTSFSQFDVITTICDYIDIWCLTIKYPYVEETERKDVTASKAELESTSKKAQ